MRLSLFGAFLGLLCLAVPGSGAKKAPSYPPSPHVASTDPKSPEEERKSFHLPLGFEAELVAAEPDIHKPINIAFDARGRLWVSGSVEYPFAAQAGRERDTVKILDDFRPDGRARKITTYAGGLNIPIGVLPLDQGAIVYSIPYIYGMTGDRGNTRADKRRILMGFYGHRDTHGMTGEFTMGFDGWVYACHGFSNTSTVKAGDGSAITMQSGNTYRFRPDGSHVEYNTHGQVNPFGLTWDPLGNLYSCDCHSRPIYQLLRGAYYPSFGKPDDGLGFGPEMLQHDHGSTAISGISYLAWDGFPKEFQGNVLIGNVVTNRINRDRLEWHGSSPKAIEMPDFLKSDDPWFRPVDIKLGPDGALYIADFYNRIIGHYEVPLDHPGRDRERGRIWRIVYRGPDGKAKPKAPRADWTRASVPALIEDLKHPNLTVRLLATNELAGRPANDVIEPVRQVMEKGSNPEQWMHGLWVLKRHGALKEAMLAAAARDSDRGVRTHAMRILTERNELPPVLRGLVLAGLRDKDPLVQRTAAQALGRHPSSGNVRALLDLRHVVPGPDSHLLHVVRMALRDQLVPASTWKEIKPLPWTEKDARAIADVCPGVPSAEAAAFLLAHIQKYPENGDTFYRYVHHAARFGTDADKNTLMEVVARDRPTDLLHQRNLIRAVQQGIQESGRQLTPEGYRWAEAITRKLLASSKGPEFIAGTDLAGSLRLVGVKVVLVAAAGKRGTAQDWRIAALNALASMDVQGSIPLMGKILAESPEPEAVREHVATLLGKVNLDPAREVLVRALPAAPARLQNVIALELARSRPGAEKLLDLVTAGKASPRMLLDKLVALRLGETRLPHLQERIAKLTHGLPTPDSQLQKLIQLRSRGFTQARPDGARGVKVYTQHCAVCHQIAGQGGRIGPNLDGVGNRGAERLLEDVLDPNRNVDQAFRLTTLNLKNGQIVSGLLLKEEGQVLVLGDSKGKEVRVPSKQVEERTVSQISPMPADFGVQIPEKDLYDLLAYLLTLKPKE